MNPMRHVSAAVLLAAILAPAAAFAATTDTAKVTMAAKTEIVPVASLVGMIGKGTKSDLAVLDTAKSVKTFDTKTLYPAMDQGKIAVAEASKSTELGKFRDAIRADAALSAWFTSNKIDVNRVIAVSNANGNPEIFLY